MKQFSIILILFSALAGAVGDDNAPPAERLYQGVLVEDPVIHLRPAALIIPTTQEIAKQLNALTASFNKAVQLEIEIAELERLSPDGRSWLSGRLTSIKVLAKTDTNKAAELLNQTKATLKGWGMTL